MPVLNISVNLVIDIGNTQIKLALFSDRKLVTKQVYTSAEIPSVIKSLFTKYDIRDTILSSVTKTNLELLKLLESKNGVVCFDEYTKIPIENLYQTPKTLGKDRLANAIGASQLFKNEHVLCIDIGTCIKFDIITKLGHYLGGSISPGVNMRFQSLNVFTAKLPLIERKDNPDLIGTTTNSSIQSGIQWGIEKEIDGTITEYHRQYPQLKVVLTGGDHIHFAKALKNSIFARPNLTLEGLNEVLIFNE